MSIRLFVEHPFSYAASVTRSFIDFWTVPLIWEPRNLTLPSLAAFANSLWWAEHKLLRAANVAFLCLVSAVLVSRKARTWARWDSAMTIISSLVLLSSLIQALADYGRVA